MRSLLIVLLSAASALAAPVASAAGCDRDALIAAATSYLAALAAGDAAQLAPLFSATNFTYKENNKASTLASAFFTKKAGALKLDYTKHIADPSACASYSEAIAVAGPFVFGTQLRHDPASSSIGTGSVVSADVIVATTGSWVFNAATTLSYVKDESWAVLDADKRTARAAMVVAADAYLDMWSNGTAINAVPWGTPCARTEGSMHFSPSCKAGVPTTPTAGMKNGNRRYVIDEAVGSIDVFCSFGSGTGGMPDSHEFRLESGKLKLVHTITV